MRSTGGRYFVSLVVELAAAPAWAQDRAAAHYSLPREIIAGKHAMTSTPRAAETFA